MKKIINISMLLAAFVLTLSACKKEKEQVVTPEVEEQELITTIKLTITDNNNVSTAFVYKVQNGFGSTTQGTVQIDTIKLAPATAYNYTIQVLNESATPVEDITEEVIAEKDEHLFLVVSDPQAGAGSLYVSDWSKDNNGVSFNQTGKFMTGAAGGGKLTVSLIHEPANKSAVSTAGAGGETDAEAMFPVVLQ